MTSDLRGAVVVWFAYVVLFSFAMWQKLRQLANITYSDVLVTLVLSGGLAGLTLGAFGKGWRVWGAILGPIFGATLIEWAVKRKARCGGA